MGHTYRDFDWYETPLYYDIVFEEDTDNEGAFLEEVLRLHATSRGKRALEPACGSGRLVAEMAGRGFQVTGFDISKESLEFASQRLHAKGLKARLREARMESFQFRERFDLAFCFVSTFKYLLTEEDARSHLQSVAAVLKPGGIYALGFHLSDYEDTHRARERWFGQRGGVHVVCNIQSWPPDRTRRVEKVRSRLIVQEKGDTRRYETHWQFRTYNVRQFNRLLSSVPELEHVATYDFVYEIGRRREFTDDQLDNIVILRRR